MLLKVTPGCKRHYEVATIRRFKVTMRNTAAIGHHMFGPFRQFDRRRCTFGMPDPTYCQKTWDKYGYVVGASSS